MKNRVLPYYCFYVQDFRASRAVKRLTHVERGLYRDLLDECWVEGGIPNDPAELADICECTGTLMASVWPTLQRFFVPHPDSDGTWMISSRMELERTEQDGRRAKAAIAGQISGAVRRAKRKGDEPPSSNRSTNVPNARTSSKSSCSIESSSSVLEVAAPPSPHGEARLSDGLGVLMAKVKSGEIKR